MNIKLVAVDMDGTLLNSKKEMPEEFIPWVKSHPEIKTVIASGRQYYTLERDFLPIRDNLAFIAENGGLVFEKGEIIFKDEIDKQDVLKAMRYFENIGEKLTAVLSGASWIDIANKTESKGNAIKAICEKYGIAHTEAMGFGDYLNDMSLLESCGESYCMKNGHPTLKALAKYVTEKTNDENGVMEVLKTL